MINILHVINGADLGGISAFILNYYSNMDREVFRFDFIYSLTDPIGHNGIELQKLGCKFYYVPVKAKHPLKHFLGVTKVIKTGEYDIVHVHSSYTSWFVLWIAKRNGINKRFAHAHNAIRNELAYIEKIKRKTGISLIRKYATRRIACSQDAAFFTFGETASDNNNVEIIQNSIHVDKYLYNEDERWVVRKEIGFSNDEIVIGTVGRMTREKNQIHLVKVFGEICKRTDCFKLFIVGDGIERKKIEETVVKLGIETKVYFTGKRSDVSRLLNSMDVFCLPSFYEGFPISALEATASGLPILLSDSITRELSEFDDVTYISLDETEQWIKEILEIQDKQRHTINKHNYEIMQKKYDISTSVIKLEEIYKDEYCRTIQD